METVKLVSGDVMPSFGLGTWQLTGETCQRSVARALKLGYRHIDTAQAYGNHRDIARGLKEAALPREELFITSKVWRDNLAREDIIRAGKESLDELEIEYLDLFLIHWPHSGIPMEDTFRGLGELKEQGLVRNIGVSNFTVQHLEEAREASEVPVAVNQVEFHPYLDQRGLLDYCKGRDIVLTAYSPLARGRIFEDEKLLKLAKRQGRSPAQVVIRWLLDRGIVVIPKASSEGHLKDNMGVFGWELDDVVREGLEGLNRDERLLDPPFAEFDR